MDYAENRCILWVGDKHSGKTTAALKLSRRLQEQGFTVGGILAPSVYDDSGLLGFDIIDILGNIRLSLSIRDKKAKNRVPYQYSHNGMKLGHSALEPARNRSADLVIVDEYGPMELSDDGWRPDVDRMLMANNIPILMVVRWSVVNEVKKLYERYINTLLEAIDPNSINRVLAFLSHRSTSKSHGGSDH